MTIPNEPAAGFTACRGVVQLERNTAMAQPDARAMAKWIVALPVIFSFMASDYPILLEMMKRKMRHEALMVLDLSPT